MQAITEYTRSTYRNINRALLLGSTNEQTAELIEVVASLPVMPGITYRTFWTDDIAGYVERLRASRTVTFAAFSSTSRSQAVARHFNGNVRFVIQGKSGRDIAAMSDKPAEQETLYLPGLTCQITKIKTVKVGGQVWSVEAELIEL